MKVIEALYNGYDKMDKELSNRGKWFKQLWDDNSDMESFYELAKDIDNDMSLSTFDRGWQYRTVLNESYKQSRIEFINIMLGFY